MVATLLLDLNTPEELDIGIILGGMAAADDEADALAQNEGDAQEAASTTCAFAYLSFPSFKWICKCVLHYTQSLLQIVCTYKSNLFDAVDQGMLK